MSLKLLKFEAEDPWDLEPAAEAPQAAAQVPAPAPAPARPVLPSPARGETADTAGVSSRALGVLRRHGLLTADDGAAPTTGADRRRALETAREFVDQAYAVPDGGWVEGGGLWTEDRHRNRRGG